LLATPGGGGGKEGAREGARDSDKNLASLAVIVNYRKALPGLGPMYYGEGGREGGREGAREGKKRCNKGRREGGREGGDTLIALF